MNLRQTKWVIGITFIAIGVGIVIATSLPKSMQYYMTVDELMNRKELYVGKQIKIAGRVSAGSVQKLDRNLNWRFRVENENQGIWVSYRGGMPDTFKEGAEVVVTGTLEPSYEMSATDVLAKCASKYEEKLVPPYKSSPQGSP